MYRNPYPPPLSGLLLRYALVLVLLESRRAMSTRELVTSLTRMGFRVDGRATKVVSDALRWEVRRGRVVRRAPDLYAVGVVARETKSRMRRRIRKLQEDSPAIRGAPDHDLTLS